MTSGHFSLYNGGKAIGACSSSMVKMSFTSSFGRRSAGFRYVVPSAVLNAIVEMKLEDFGGSFRLLTSSM